MAKRKLKRRPWYKSELKMLRTMARKRPAHEIAKAVKRSEGATRQKAFQIGLSLALTGGN